MALIPAISILYSVLLLENKDIAFYPSVIFNNSTDYSIVFQMNTLVKSAPFVIGLFFGIVFVNALDKIEGDGTRSNEFKFGKIIKKSVILQYVLQFIGLVLVNVSFWLIVPTFDDPKSSFTWFFLSTTPTLFCIGLGILITPSILGGTGAITQFINALLGTSSI